MLNLFTRIALLALVLAVFTLQAEEPAPAPAGALPAEKQWVVFEGKDGPGKGKHIVFVTGDDEYHSEEGMPQLAKILAEKHGFTCTVLFAINKATGVIDVATQDNIPGLEALDTADLMVIFTRFRNLPDDQMKHIIDYLDTGKGVIGLRTATHAFNLKAPSSYTKYTWTSKEPGFEGGFGRQVLGETWINHWGKHGGQATRGLINKDNAADPILKGIKDGEIWGTTDVYQVKLPMFPNVKPLVMGSVLVGMKPDDVAAGPVEDPKTKATVDKNNPMMPVAWTRTYKGPSGKESKVFCTTMGGAMSGGHDWDNEGLRRLLVNAAYWAVNLEDKIPEKADVSLPWPDSPFKRGVKPQVALQAAK